MPRYNNPRKTWFYSNEFKIKAVKLSYQSDIQSKQVADGLGIHPLMLSRWRKEYREGKIQGDGQKRVGVSNKRKSPPIKELTENAKLKKEVERLKKENDLLKKWQQFLAEKHQNDLDSSTDTDHTKTKAMSPQTNGICERFHKTILNEFYQITFRKKLYDNLDDLQKDLDEWMDYYNNERTHQGKMCCGRTPLETLLDGKSIWAEKNLAQI